jgi:5-methylthioadenosine/S-adenosylhomocysteine deaminase
VIAKISAGIVVTANDRMDVWRPGYMIIHDGVIAEAGPGNGPNGDFDEDLSKPDSILMPGLVNGHAHSPSNLVKGTWSRLPLEIWRQHIRAAWREYSDEALHVSAQLGVIEMIRTGCTAVMDHFYSGSQSPYMGALNVVEAIANAGMRGGLALTLSDQRYEATVGIQTDSLPDEARAEVDRISRHEGRQSLDDFLRFAQAVRSRTQLVLPIVGPSAPHRCSTEQLVRCMEVANDLDTMVHMHVCETKGQFMQGAENFGRSPVAHLDEIGVLNDRLSMAHCVWLTDDDLNRIAKRGSIVIHNPASNGKLGSGRMRFDEMLRRHVRVGLATDGSGSNDTQNMFEAMRMAGVLHNRHDRDYEEWPSAKEILCAATSGSARALGLGDRLGVIGKGKLADIAVLTTNSFPFVPLNDVINQIVYCENGISVTDVLVNGRWLMRDKTLVTMDENKIYRNAGALRMQMEERIQEQFRRTSSLEAPLRQAYFKTAKASWST